VTLAAARRSDSASLGLALVYAAIFFEMGVQIPFLPVWLAARGLTDDQIAVVLAAPLALRVVSTPLLTALADRRHDVPGMLAASTIVLASSCAMLGFLHGFAPLLAAVTILLCAQGLVMPLADALASMILHASAREGGRTLDYGRIRKWGSAAFIAGNLAGGIYLSLVPIDGAPAALTATALLGVAAAFYIAPLAEGLQERRSERVAAPSRQGLGRLSLVIMAAAFVQTSHALVNTFGSIHWAREGHSSAFVGACWAIGVVCEVAIFASASRWFAGADRAFVLLALGATTAVVRWLVMASDPNATLLLAAQASHGLTFASTHLGSMLFIFAEAPSHMRARAQGWLAGAISGLSALLIALSGPLYAHFGEIAYLAMAALAASGLALIIALGLRKSPS
jgi:MFS transporter, PPP family, 3-phenylpropionic acid transporter